MSNPKTNYTVGGVDLSSIFQPISLGSASLITTNYSVFGYGDLNNIFAAYTGGSQAVATGYSVDGYGDLNTIFAKFTGGGGTQTITFTSTNVGTQTIQNGFKLVSMTTINGPSVVQQQRPTDYTFTMTGFSGKTINFCVVGGGSGGQHGFIGSQGLAGGSGGSGGQTIVGTYTITSNSIACTVRVGAGGYPSYYGNGFSGTTNTDPGGLKAGGDSFNVSGTLYGTTNANDTYPISNINCAGGYSNLVCTSGQWGTIKAMGGGVGDQTTTSVLNSCPSTGQSLGTGTTSTLYLGASGGIGIDSGVPYDGASGTIVSIAGNNIVFGSSAGGATRDNADGAGVSGVNAAFSGGGYTDFNTGGISSTKYDSYPATDNTGSGGGGGAGSGGPPYLAVDTNYSTQTGGYGGSGVVYIWYT
jgi:hypothetical protein